MRLPFLVLALACACLLVAGGGVRFVAAVWRLPGNDAAEYAATGYLLAEASAQRAIDSRQNALRVVHDRRTLVELAILYHDQAIQQEAGSPEQERLYDLSLEAFDASFALSPVQPLAWFQTAQIHYSRGAFEPAAEATDWALRTGYYLQHQTAERALMAIALWDRLAEPTRQKSMATIVDVLKQETAAVATAAVQANAVEDLLLRLRETGPGGAFLAAELGAAANRFRDQERQRLAMLEEISAMRRTLLATSMLALAGLPVIAGAMTVHEYLMITRGEDPTRGPETVDSYLRAALDGLLVLGYFNHDAGAALFCMPNREVIDVDIVEFRANLDALLEQFEAEMPNFDALARTRSVGLASLELLTVMYPCTD